MSCRLYVTTQSLRSGELTVAGDDHHYLFRVRRLRSGDEVVVFDGEGHHAVAVVERIEAKAATLRIGEVGNVAASRPQLLVLQSLIKGERMEWCVQKLVELGATKIIPVRAARCVVKLDHRRAKSRHERLLAIARDAARQCGGTIVPEIVPVLDLAEAIEHVAEAPLKLLCWARAEDGTLRAALPQAPPESIAILVGPEGGFEADEVDRAVESGFIPVGLGPRTLRAETAAVAAAAVLGYAFETTT